MNFSLGGSIELLGEPATQDGNTNVELGGIRRVLQEDELVRVLRVSTHDK